MSNPVCAVIGVGPGNGTAIARKFSSEGYKIALLSRNEDYLNELAHECGDARAYAYDALDTTAPEKVFGKIKQELGSVDVLVYNVGSGMFGSVDKINLSDFERRLADQCARAASSCQGGAVGYAGRRERQPCRHTCDCIRKNCGTPFRL